MAFGWQISRTLLAMSIQLRSDKKGVLPLEEEGVLLLAPLPSATFRRGMLSTLRRPLLLESNVCAGWWLPGQISRLARRARVQEREITFLPPRFLEVA